MCACTVGANVGPKATETKSPSVTSEEPGANIRCWEQKQVLNMSTPLHLKPQRGELNT